MSAMRRRAFTLVELLVVIGIIAVLTALLLPVLSGARRKATQVACLSYLRQLGAALFAYAGENRGWFPGPASGRDVYPEDWVHWQQGRDVNAGSIVPFLGRNTPACSSAPWGWRSGRWSRTRLPAGSTASATAST